jgi:AP-1 complex subunit mu
MALSALYILDQKGKILISRNYRGDVPFNSAERFISRLLEEDDELVKPIIEEEGVSYLYVKQNNLYCMRVAPLLPFLSYPSQFSL